MNQQRDILVGMIGCGQMGAIHADSFAATPGIRCAAWFNPTAKKAEALAGQFGGAVVGSVEELVGMGDLDAVAIASPQAVHAEHILAAVAAGKHVFCEKPVALTKAELDTVTEAVTKAGVVFMTGHQMRLHPVVETVRDHLADLGTVYHMDLEWCFRIEGHTGRCWESYRLGGFCMELGCHAMDLVGTMLGVPVHVSAHALRIDPQRITEDYVNALIQTRRGAVAQVLVSANHRTKRQGLLQGRVLGSEGRIEFTVYPYTTAFNRARLILDKGEKIFVPDVVKRDLAIPERPSPTSVYPGFFDVYHRQAAAFRDAIAKGTPPPATLQDGRNAVELVLACYHQQALASEAPNLVHRPAEWRSDAAAHPLVR